MLVGKGAGLEAWCTTICGGMWFGWHWTQDDDIAHRRFQLLICWRVWFGWHWTQDHDIACHRFQLWFVGVWFGWLWTQDHDIACRRFQLWFVGECGLADIRPRVMILHVADSNSDLLEYGLADFGPRIIILHTVDCNSDFWLTLDPGSYCMSQVPTLVFAVLFSPLPLVTAWWV